MAINSLGASSKGISGLVSGMDTQQMVESMLAGTQGKIDAAKQKQMTLTYKQTMYRGVAAKLQAFQTSYFSYVSTSSANLRSQQFFSSMSASSSSSAFKASAATGATAGKTVVNYVRQLAQNMKLKADNKASGKLTGTFDVDEVRKMAENLADAKNNLKIQAGTDTAVEISLADVAGMSEFEMERVLQNKLSRSNITVEYKSGQFTFKDLDGEALTISGSEDAMALVGLGRTSQLYNEKGTITTSLNGKNVLPSINVTLNGVTKGITFDPTVVLNATDPLDPTNPTAKLAAQTAELATQLNKGLQNAFGSGASVEVNGDGKIEFKTKDTSSVLKVARPAYQASGLDALGIASGSSTKIAMGMTIAEANFVTDVVGDVQRFSIGGVDFSFASDTSLSEMISTINASDAGVKISYLDVEDKFVMESTVTGELASVDENNPFKMSQKDGNLLTAMFGVQSGSAATGNSLTYNKSVTGTESFTADEKLFDLKDKSIDVKYGGITYVLTFKGKDDGSKYTLQEMADELNGIAENIPTIGENQLKFSVATGGDGKQSLSISSVEGKNFAISGLDGFTDPTDPTAPKTMSFGIASGSTVGTMPAKGSNTLAELGLGGTTITIGKNADGTGGKIVNATGTMTLNEFTALLNTAVQDAMREKGATSSQIDNSGAKFDENTGRYRIFGVDIPMTFEVNGDDGKLFGTSEFKLGSNSATGPEMTMIQKGQNSIVSINGSEIERSSNEFTVNGISYELKEVNMKQDKDADGHLLYLDEHGNTTTASTAADGTANRMKGADNAEAIMVSRDTEKIVEGLKKFVEEYNKLVDDINGLLDADAKEGCRAYPPLTTEQKEGMSDKEIELWEEKSQQGLLRNDSVLEGVMQSLRNTLYTRPDGTKVSLYDIGITTANPLSGTKDHLELDEAKLSQMVAEVPDEIMKLFTDETKGLANLMNNAIDNAVRTTPDNLGSIVLQAGATGRTITDSFLYKELKSVDERITSLNRTYKSEYERYWSQFNKMEQVINQMNQQSSWLSQQFSS